MPAQLPENAPLCNILDTREIPERYPRDTREIPERYPRDTREIPLDVLDI